MLETSLACSGIKPLFKIKQTNTFPHPQFSSFILPMSPSMPSGCHLYRVMVLGGKSYPSVSWTNSLPDTLKNKCIIPTQTIISPFPSLCPRSPEMRINWYALSQHAGKAFRGIRVIFINIFCDGIADRYFSFDNGISKYRGE